MPNYTFKCDSCNIKRTVTRRVGEGTEPPDCRECGKEMTRIYHAPAVNYKADGFTGAQSDYGD